MNIAAGFLKSLLRQKGGATAEFIFTVPVLLVLGLGGLQTLFFYDAKTTLNYAAFEAAREGAVNHAQSRNMRNELGVRLAPIFGGDGTASEALQAMAESTLEVNNPLFTKIEVLNPTREAFNDFGVESKSNGRREIPNDNLKYRSREVGPSSGVNIQDANILKIKVTYGYQLEVPVVNKIIPSLLKWTDPANAAYYAAGRLPVTAVATVRMQSPAWADNNASSGGGGGGGGTPPDSSDPGESQPPGGDDTGSDDGASDSDSDSGDSGSDGSGDDNSGGGSGENPGNSGGDTNAGGNGPANGDPDELACEQKTIEEDTDGANSEDASTWDNLWGTISGGVTYAYDFLKGFWEGIKGQLGDIANIILHPIDTANGLIELGKAFYNDFEGTATAIAEALGKDFSTLVQCGAYDKGRIIGNYVSPAFMLKLATKLANFGDLAKAINATKKDFGCASFAAGTGVWTTQGAISIEDIGVGAQVLSRNDASFDDGNQSVEKLFQRTAPEYYLLTTENEQLKVTGEHPVWKQGSGWTEARKLRVDDVVVSAEGDILILNNQRVAKPLHVYNFKVENTHNYFVGEGKLWAHNAACVLPDVLDTPTGLKKFNSIVDNNNLGLDSEGLTNLLRAQTKSRGETWSDQQAVLDSVKRASDAELDAVEIKGFPTPADGDTSFILRNAQKYQAESSGDALLSFKKNGVSFDDVQDGVLIDRKYGHGDSIFNKDGTIHNQGRVDSAIKQARAQLEAADGTPVRWEVSTRLGAEGLQEAFNKARLNIQVKHVVQKKVI